MNTPTLHKVVCPFVPFPKIARLCREIVITEKLDGTNASVCIEDVEVLNRDEYEASFGKPLAYSFDAYDRIVAVRAGSRSRFITPEQDNHGFAKWVIEHVNELALLGPGRHYGEWWGKGIQRNYGINQKVFSLFNTERWNDSTVRPSCCSVVPMLYKGKFTQEAIERALHDLKTNGSYAAPFYMDPEGIVVYHTAANISFKVTLKDDEKGKSQ